MKMRLDPAVMAITAFVLVVSFAVVSGFMIDNQNISFSEACTTMGGVPLIGHNGTKVCFKVDTVLSVN